MSRLIVAVVSVCFLGITGQAVLAAVTVSCDASKSVVSGNDVVELECFIETDIPLSLNSYQITLPCAWSLGVGASGSVDHFEIPATSCTFVGGADLACNLSGFQATCDGSTFCFSSAQCGADACVPDPNNPGISYCENSGTCLDPSPFIISVATRSDFIFRGLAGTDFITGVQFGCPSVQPQVSGLILDGSGVPLVPANTACPNGNADCPVFSPCVTPTLDSCAMGGVDCVCSNTRKYIGSFRYRVSDCAAEDFNIAIVGNSTPPFGSDLSQVKDDLAALVQIQGASTTVNVDVGLCCDGLGCLGDANEYCCLNVQGGILANASASCGIDPCVCTADPQCGDANDCTVDFCSPGNPASDSFGCVHDDTTPSGFCCDPVGAALSNCTDDGNPCTIEMCNGPTCLHDGPAADGLTCAGDGDFCTLDVCDTGSCGHFDITAMACETIAGCPSNADGCTGSVGNPGLCTCTPPVGPCFGDIVPPTGVVDLDDILCMLSGFNEFALCPGGDIFPCGGNAVIDIDDILAVLAAFAGDALCGFPCG